MPTMRLVIPLLLAFPLTLPISHLHAQYVDPVESHQCPVPATGFGAALSYFIGSTATPGGENHRLANKICFNNDRDLSDQNTMTSTTPASSATTSYSYHVGSGRLSVQAEVNATGHRADVPISGGTNHLVGRGGGHVSMWLYWVDLLTFQSAATKPLPTAKGAIDPAQVVEVQVTLRNQHRNQCSGGGTGNNFYTTSVGLVTNNATMQPIGGHTDMSVDSDCLDQQVQDTTQVLLGLGHLRIELSARIQMNGFAQGEEAPETADVKVKMGEYRVCLKVLKGPSDLKITSASGVDYTCK
jgi:hypothetical protein